jgi:hypothetical protein
MDSQEELRTKLKINDSIAALVGLLGTMVAIVENNMLFEETPVKPRYVQNGACKAMRAVQTVTAVILGKTLKHNDVVILIVRHSLLYFNFMKDRRKILRESKNSIITL